MAEPAPLLSVKQMSAGYGGRHVVESIALTVRAGDLLGLLGANGSGKSTLLRAVTGQIPLLGGRVLIGGIDLFEAPEQAKRGFGYAVDGADLPHPLTARQYLGLVASIRGCAPDHWPCDDLIGALSLGRWLGERIADCSLGTRMKISLAAAFLGAPPLLILDESLNGLDPVSSWRIRRILANLVRSGRHAVVLSSHMIETLAVTCTAAVFLEAGHIAHRWGAAELAEGPVRFEARVMRALGEPI